MGCHPDNPQLAEITANKLIARMKGAGAHVPDDAAMVGPNEAKVQYARITGNQEKLTITEALNESNDLGSQLVRKFQAETSAPDSLFWVRDPGVVLGEDFVAPLTEALIEHRAQFGGRFSDESFNAYKQEILPLVEDMRLEADNLPLSKKYFADDWLDYYEKGGEFYHSKQPKSLIGHLAQNAIRNLVQWNPTITMLNAFEFLPKAIPQYGVKNTIEGMRLFMDATGGKFWQRIPELDSLGVYGTHTSEHNFSRLDLLQLTENPLRGLSYFTGEAARPGGGFEALQRIAFVYQPGHVPKILWNTESAQTIALMRYSLEATKLYSQWLTNVVEGVRTGNTQLAANGATALAAFSLIQAIQTGIPSTIPEPIWNILPQETRDDIEQFDRESPFNLMTKVTGLDVSEKTRPLPNLGFGIGFQLVEGSVGRFGSGLRKGSEAAFEGDTLKAGVEFTKGLLGLGLIGPVGNVAGVRMPGMNMTARKFFDIIGDAVTGEIEPEEIPGATAEKFGLVEAE